MKVMCLFSGDAEVEVEPGSACPICEVEWLVPDASTFWECHDREEE